MAPSNHPIPGYTFDVEKNRYFKIVPNHLAPEGSQFSAQEVKRRKRMRTADCAPPPAGKRLGNGLKLLREVGLSRRLMKESIVESWANGLEKPTLLFPDGDCYKGPDITHFVRDEWTGEFLFTRGTLEDQTQAIFGGVWPSRLQSEEEKCRDHGLAGHPFICTGVQSIQEAPISSLSLSRSRMLLATHVALRKPQIAVMPLLDLPDYDKWTGYRVGCRSFGQIFGSPALIEIRNGKSHQNLSPAWCSAVNPFSEQPKFAIGLAGHVVEVSGHEGGFAPVSGPVDRDDTTFGVDWLDHNTVVSGGRRGEVCLWDMRMRSHGHCVRFRHPTQINHVRKLEGSRVAVAGTNESIYIQDLRHPPTNDHEPYLSFPTSGGPIASHLIAGFDVHDDLIAAATADGRVQLFSVSTGKEVRMRRIESQQQGRGGGGGDGGNGGQKRCIKFLDNDEREDRMMLCVATDGIVEEWS